MRQIAFAVLMTFSITLVAQKKELDVFEWNTQRLVTNYIGKSIDTVINSKSYTYMIEDSTLNGQVYGNLDRTGLATGNWVYFSHTNYCLYKGRCKKGFKVGKWLDCYDLKNRSIKIVYGKEGIKKRTTTTRCWDL